MLQIKPQSSDPPGGYRFGSAHKISLALLPTQRSTILSSTCLTQGTYGVQIRRRHAQFFKPSNTAYSAVWRERGHMPTMYSIPPRPSKSTVASLRHLNGVPRRVAAFCLFREDCRCHRSHPHPPFTAAATPHHSIESLEITASGFWYEVQDVDSGVRCL